MFRQEEIDDADKGLQTLPEEIIRVIFYDLNNAELHDIAQTSHYYYLIASKAYWVKEIIFYKERSEQSILWQHLNVIAGNQTLATTFQGYLKGMCHIMPDILQQVSSLHSLIQTANQTTWLRHNPLDITAIQTYLQEVIDYLVKTNSLPQPPYLATHQDFMAYMNSPNSSLTQKGKCWRAYYKLDRALTTAIFSICFDQIADLPELLRLLDQPLLTRFITGKDLLSLDAIYSNGNLINGLIRKAIALHEQVDKTSEETDSLKIITNMLSRLTGEDMLSHIQTGEQQNQLALFNHIFEHNYALLLDKLNEENLIKLIKYSCNPRVEPTDQRFTFIHLNHPLIDSILNNSTIIQKLSQAGLLFMLNQIALSNPEYLTRYHALDPFLTGPLLMQWVNSNEKSFRGRKSQVILTHADLLARLESKQIAILFQPLLHEAAIDILNSKTFIERLQAEARPNQLLLDICIENPDTFIHDVARNEKLAGMFLADELMHLSDISCLVPSILFKHKTVINKLSSEQLLSLCRSELTLAVENNHFRKLNDCDLILFLYEKITFLGRNPAILASIKNEASLRLAHSEVFLLLLQNYLDHPGFDRHFSDLLREHRANCEPPTEVAIAQSQSASTEGQSAEYQASIPQAADIITQLLLTKNIEEKTNWRRSATIVALSLLALIGVTLIVTGIGSAAGVPTLASAASFMFSWLPLSTGISAILAGASLCLITLIKSVFLHLTENTKENKKTDITLNELHQTTSASRLHNGHLYKTFPPNQRPTALLDAQDIKIIINNETNQPSNCLTDTNKGRLNDLYEKHTVGYNR